MYSTRKGFLIPLVIGFTVFFMSIFIAMFNFGDFSKPQKTIIVKFKDAGPLPDKLPVYYKGIKIGKVTKADFSDDYRHTFLTVKIDNKDFNPPKNIYAELRIEDLAQVKAKGFSLKKYLAVVYPAKPSQEKLKDGDIIEGRSSYINQFQDFFKKSVKKEQIEATANDVFSSTTNLNKISENLMRTTKRIDDFLAKNQKNFDEIVDNSRAATENFSHSSAAIREFTETTLNNPDLKLALQDMPAITENIKDITSSARLIAVNPCFQEGLMKTSYGMGRFAEKLDRSVNETDLRCLVKNTNRILCRYDCFGESLSDLLTKRFLILRMFFGKPGSAFEKCKSLYPQCVICPDCPTQK